MEFNDILGLGKVLPLDKLLDVIQKAVGRGTKSYFERQDVKTEVYKIKELAKAKAEEITIISQAMLESSVLKRDIDYKDKIISISSSSDMQKSVSLALEERISQRTSYQENKKQLNLENITSLAAEQLTKEETVTDEPLDEDWITRFFRIAEDISNEDMQALWAKILAGEIKKPKSFSVRTLEIIKNISQREAEVFKQVANFAITENMKSYFLFTGGAVSIYNNKAINFNHPFNDISTLKEIGLLQSIDLISLSYNKPTAKSRKYFLLGKKIILWEQDENKNYMSFNVELFTTAGNELLQLIDKTAPREYINVFENALEDPNYDMIEADFVEYKDNILHFDNEIVIKKKKEI
jgi:uncharacterized repeat protein (TIGR03899 family)